MMKKMNSRVFIGTCLSCLSVFSGGCRVEDKAIVLPVGGAEQTIAAESGAKVWQADTETQQSATKVQQNAADEGQMICVHVCGAVERPGIVKLPEGSRVWEALQSAGGFSETAQEDYVNLAERLSDGQRIYFPDREEARELAERQEQLEKGLININTADEEELCGLPGIGSARARDIIAYREAYGSFEQKEDLMKVSGIKESTYSRLCDKIIVR
ncbi:MAG: helix-hairpin-helix domain-containing protein [Acetatifactor sp.]